MYPASSRSRLKAPNYKRPRKLWDDNSYSQKEKRKKKDEFCTLSFTLKGLQTYWTIEIKSNWNHKKVCWKKKGKKKKRWKYAELSLTTWGYNTCKSMSRTIDYIINWIRLTSERERESCNMTILDYIKNVGRYVVVKKRINNEWRNNI